MAYFKNRYSPKIYPVTASVIIREKEEASGADLLYKNSLIEGYRNYLNEPYIIKSYPLIGNVIKKLNFEVVFINEGKIKTSEAYKLPVKVRLLKRNGSYGASLVFKVINEKIYSVKNATENVEEKEAMFYFSDSVEFNGHHFIVFQDSLDDVKRILNMPYKLTFLDPNSVTENYVGRLNVQWAEEGSGVLNLSINGSNPEKEIDFMNGLISTYQQYDLEKKNQTAERTIQFIKKQLTEISDSLKISEAQLEQFKISNSSEKLDDEAKRLFDKLAPLESQRSELVIRANYYSYLMNYITKGDNLDLIVLPAAVGVNDPILSSLVEKMINSQLDLKLFLGKGKDENPLVKGGVKRLDELRKDLIESVKTLRATDNLKAELIKKEISDLDKLIDHLPVAQRQFISIQRNYTLLDNLYIFLMQKMSEAGISKASNVSDIVPVNPPMKGAIISPNTSQNYFIGWVIGLLIPIAAFVLIEFLNQKIQSREDLDKITTIPFIGGIGHYQTKDNLAVSNKPKSPVAESFRAIRSNLSFFTSNQTKKVFMVSSSISGEGKTFSTINLATVFAMSGRKTLIIGADMRKPKIFSDFGLTNDRGLSGYLSMLNSLSDVIQETSIENLDLISSGPVPPNPSELLLSDRIGNLITEALQLYDYILIDTPPMAIVTDAFVISKYADHTIFVTRQNYTPKAFLRDIQEFYSAGKLKNISLVLNDIYRTGLGYGYGYGYGNGYGYGYGYGKSKGDGGYYS
ncbi:MAG: polysaccharide biosynthesis tyrosine autokinase [Bacteroidetes bacterium]|nr:polysaccharide biosynthesis tyrosine autokinase [Bacteroidota bacterium]